MISSHCVLNVLSLCKESERLVAVATWSDADAADGKTDSAQWLVIDLEVH